MVVEQQREADLPFRPSVAHAGNDERHRPGQMRCRIEDDGPFVQRLFDEAEIAELQIAKPAVQQLGGGRRRAAAKVAAFSQANAQPASGGVPGGSEERRVGTESVSTCRFLWSP